MDTITALKAVEINRPDASSASKAAGLSQEKPQANTIESPLQTGQENSRTSSSLSRDKLEKVATAIDDFIKSTDWNLKIQIHKETDQFMAQIISLDDGQVIREIPPKELLNLAAKIEEEVGLLLNKLV